MEGLIGEVKVFAGNFAPRTWAFCHGQIYSIADNQALYSIIGTFYGGDGRNTFGLPDLRGRSAVGAGAGDRLNNINLGEIGGNEYITLGLQNLPSHSHRATFDNARLQFINAQATGYVSPSAFTGRGNLTNEPTGNFPAQAPSGTNIYNNVSNTVMGRSSLDINIREVNMELTDVDIGIRSEGGGQAFGNRSPYIGMNWIICVAGLYPSRN